MILPDKNRPFQRFFQLFHPPPRPIMKNPGTVRDSVPHPRPPRRRHLGHSPAFASNKQSFTSKKKSRDLT